MSGPPDLAGRVALVSGGGRGIGRAIAIAMARNGARVAVASRTASDVLAVAAECGSEALPIELDVREQSSCEAAVRQCSDRLGGLDILVNAAGIASSEKFSDLTLDRWRAIFSTNLEGSFLLIKAALPEMLAGGWGRVISIGSTASRSGSAYIAAYAAAKHGLLGLTRSLAAEYVKTGITFNCVCPGFVDTRMTEETIRNIGEKTGRTPEEARRALLSPQGRLIEPQEVAEICRLLASDAGRSINGQAITVDGGALLT